MPNLMRTCLASVGLGLLARSLSTGMAASQGQTIVLRLPVEVNKMYKIIRSMEVRCYILNAGG